MANERPAPLTARENRSSVTQPLNYPRAPLTARAAAGVYTPRRPAEAPYGVSAEPPYSEGCRSHTPRSAHSSFSQKPIGPYGTGTENLDCRKTQTHFVPFAPAGQCPKTAKQVPLSIRGMPTTQNPETPRLQVMTARGFQYGGRHYSRRI